MSFERADDGQILVPGLHDASLTRLSWADDEVTMDFTYMGETTRLRVAGESRPRAYCLDSDQLFPNIVSGVDLLRTRDEHLAPGLLASALEQRDIPKMLGDFDWLLLINMIYGSDLFIAGRGKPDGAISFEAIPPQG